MAAVVTERVTSGEVKKGQNPSATLRYVISEETDEALALAALLTASPSLFLGIARQTYGISPIGDPTVSGLWDGEVTYANSSGSQNPAETGDSFFNFDTTGGQVHITQSILTTDESFDGALLPAQPDFNRSIGVGENGAVGTDIIEGAFQFSETHYFAASFVTTAYKLICRNLTGTVNDAAFKGFAAEEVLFLGATGSRRGTESTDGWEINYKFAAGKNVVGLDLAPNVPNVDKKAWEWAWVYYMKQKDANAKFLRDVPVAAFVEQVYNSEDFSTLGIGT